MMGCIAKKHPIQDAHFSSTKALLHFDNNLTDVKGNTWTATGSAAASATESKFGGYSLSVPSGTNYISSADVDLDWYLSSNPFTIEAWVYRNSTSGTNAICSRWASSRAYIWYFDGANGRIAFKWISGVTTTTIEWTLDHNTDSVWDYISVSRQSSSAYAHQNGTALTVVGSNSLSGAVNNGNRAFHIGINDDGNVESFNGYIDDFRFTNGVGRYGSGGYTVPSLPHPNS